MPCLNIAKHVLITGGSSGLGKELARLLLKRGARVTIVARRMTQLEETKAELTREDPQLGSKLFVLSVDVTNSDECVRMVEEAEAMQKGPIDAIFCCAGAALPGFFLDQNPQILRDQMALNYLGAVNAIHVICSRDLFFFFSQPSKGWWR